MCRYVHYVYVCFLEQVVQFNRNENGNTLAGIVQASDVIHISSQTEGAEMKKSITVNLPIYDDVDDKDTELVVARCNDTEVQVNTNFNPLLHRYSFLLCCSRRHLKTL